MADHQTLVQAHLNAGETLIETTQGHIGGAGMEWILLLGLFGRWLFNQFFANWQVVALTDQRVLMIKRKDGSLVNSWPLADIKSLTYKRDAGWVSSTIPGDLDIRTEGEDVKLEIQGKKWRKQSDLLAHRFRDARKKA